MNRAGRPENDLTLGTRAVRSPRRRSSPPRHLRELCWGTPHEAKEELARIKDLTESLAAKLRLSDGRKRLGRRVSFDDALSRPVHGWFHYKEGYSPSLLSLILTGLDVPAKSAILDPFAGVGTTVLAATELNPQRFTRAIGIEYNPFSAFVARTKLRWSEVSSEKLLRDAERVLKHRSQTLPPIPDSATLRNRKIFPAARLLRLRELSSGVAALPSGPTKAVLRLALAAILEQSSYAKKDGRALRILGSTARTATPAELFEATVQTMAMDIRLLKQRQREGRRLAQRKGANASFGAPFEALVHRGDARNLRPHVKRASVGLAMYSPPYLNGIDYSEVYKVEEYFLGFVKDPAGLRRLREGTLRSHASIQFPERRSSLGREVSPRTLVRRLIRAVCDFFGAHEMRQFQRQYRWLVEAYFADMYEAFKEQRRVLKAGGYAVCVVANSMFAGPPLTEIASSGVTTKHPRWQLPLATDVILSALAREAGLSVLPSFAVRTLRPRNVPAGWSRESVLIFRKPHRSR